MPQYANEMKNNIWTLSRHHNFTPPQTHINGLKVILAKYYNCSKVVVEYTFLDSP